MEKTEKTILYKTVLILLYTLTTFLSQCLFNLLVDVRYNILLLE